MTARIGYVLKRYPRYSETFVVNEILAHENAGMEIDIFALRHGNDNYYQDIISKVKAPVFHLPRQGLKLNDFWRSFRNTIDLFPDFWQNMSVAGIEEDAYDVVQALLLCEKIQQRKITHLHAHFLTSATSVARIAAKITGISFTATAHAKDIYHESVDEEKIQHYINDCKALVTVSDYNVDFLRNKYQFDNKLIRIYNGLDLDRFEYYPGPREKNSIISVGRFVEKKGFEVLIEACAILKSEGIDFTCNLVGSGEARTLYEDLISRSALTNQVKILGPKPQAELIDYVKRSSLMVAPCVVGEDGNRDGLPTVLLEAMALGTPCVSTDVTGIPEVIKHGETGVICKQGDAQDLANNIKVILQNSEMQSLCSQQARGIIERHFNIEKNTQIQRELFVDGLEK